MLFTASLVSTVVLLVLICLTWRNNRHVSEIPKPEANLFLGHLMMVKKITGLLNTLSDLTLRYGGIIRIYIPPLKPSILVADKDILQNLMNNDNSMEKSKDYQFLKIWLGEGLITGGGSQWRNHRRMLTPCFGRMSTLKHYVQIFEKLGNILVEKFNDQLDNPSLDVFPYMKLFTMEVMCETSMGIKTNCQRDGNIIYCLSIEEMTRIAVHRILSPFRRFDWFYQFTNEYQKQKRALKEINTFYEKIMNNKRNEVSNSIKDEEGSKHNFLNQLLRHQENGEALSDEDIKEEINTFMFGGHDTTATGLSYILYTLGSHPGVQVISMKNLIITFLSRLNFKEKILEEQKTIFGSLENEPQPTYADLQEMKYLEAVINEALRLYPPIPIIGRRLTNDIKLDNGITLPKFMNVGCFIYAVHHNPKYFPDPEKFIPDRFLQDDILPYTHLAFSAGPRNCIGKKFAMLQIKSCISKIVRHFKLLPSVPEHKLELLHEITLVSKNGIRISLEKRNT